MHLVLYYSPGACSLAAHIALRELGLPFELRRATISKREHLSPEYLALNPRGRVPLLLVDGQPIRELSAILSWLDELKCGLFPPPKTVESARCREWISYFASTVHITFAQIWRGERFLSDPALHKLLRTQAYETLLRQFDEVEERLAAGPYLAGDAFTVADANALVFYRWGRRVGVDMANEFPAWTEHTKRLLERASVKQAVAEEGIDIWASADPATKEKSFSAAALAEFSAAWTNRDVNALMRHMHPDGVYSASVGPEPGETFRGPDLRAGIEKMLSHDSAHERRSGRSWLLGDIAFAEWSFIETLPGGRRRTIRGIDYFEFEGDQIKLKDAYRKVG